MSTRSSAASQAPASRPSPPPTKAPAPIASQPSSVAAPAAPTGQVRIFI